MKDRKRKKKLEAFRDMVKLVKEVKPVVGKELSFKKAKEEIGMEKYSLGKNFP